MIRVRSIFISNSGEDKNSHDTTLLLTLKTLTQELSSLNNLCLLSPQGISIVGPSNAEPPPRPPSPAMYQVDIVLKKGNNLAIRDRTGGISVSLYACQLNHLDFYAKRWGRVHPGYCRILKLLYYIFVYSINLSSSISCVCLFFLVLFSHLLLLPLPLSRLSLSPCCVIKSHISSSQLTSIYCVWCDTFPEHLRLQLEHCHIRRCGG